MRYLRPVRINESKSARKTLNKVRRYHAESDAARSGKPGAARRARAANARFRANTYGNDTAKIPFVKDSAISLGKQEAEKAKRLENSSIIPLTLPNLMEINIVKGSDGKPVVASGKGTRLKNIAQPTEAALKRRRAGTQHAGSEGVLKRLQASNRRTALIKRGRRKEATQVPSPPASTDGIGGNRPGGDAGTGEAIRHRIASRGHTR